MKINKDISASISILHFSNLECFQYNFLNFYGNRIKTFHSAKVFYSGAAVVDDL